MIRQERMRELQEQRLAEEAAAARQLKDNSKPHFGRVRNGPASSLDLVRASAGAKRGGSSSSERAAGGPAAEAAEAEQQVDEAAADATGAADASQYVM